MSEHIRSVTIHVEVDTNKQTYTLDINEGDYALDEMPGVIREFLDGVAS